MSECKVKIKVDVCGESALDQVTTLIVKEEMDIKAACVKVANEFNASNDGATVKWGTLRQAYYRSNKVDRVTCNTESDKRVTCNTEAVKKKLDIPTVEVPKSDSDEVVKLKADLKKSRAAINKMVLSQQTYKANNPTVAPVMPPCPPSVDNNTVMVNKDELGELVSCQAELLLIKLDLDAMNSLLTPEQRLRYDNRNNTKDVAFEEDLAKRKNITAVIAKHLKTD